MARLRNGVCLVGVWLVAATAAAQTAQPDSVSARAEHDTAASVSVAAPTMAELLERLDALQRRVESLEQQLDATRAAAAPVAAIPVAGTTQPSGEHAGAPAQMQMAGPEQPQYPSLQLHGFADVNYSDTDEPSPGGFHMGQVVLHFASAIGPKVNVFAEASFAPRSASAVSAVPINYATDIERAFIRYDHSDAFKVSFGRYHTPTSYWNNAYHHGLFLQTTISRPEIIQFGTPYVPVHFVGVLAEGNLPGSGLGLGYSVGLGNGRSTATRAGDAGDTNSHRAWLGTFRSRPAGVRDLEFGVSLYRDRFAPSIGTDTDEWTTGAHVAFTRESPELIAEFVNVRHVLRSTGEAFNNPGFYIQGAYRLPWQGGKWKPYARFENLDIAEGGPILTMFDSRTATFGVRYDVADFAAFKGEYRHVRRQLGDPRINGLFLQTSFTF